MNVDEVVERCGWNPTARLRWVKSDGGVQETTFAELQALALRLGAALTEAGLQAGHVVGIQAENCTDWVVWDMALARLHAVLRPYPSHHQFDPTERIAEHGLALLVSDRPEHQGRPGVCPISPAGLDPHMVQDAAPRAADPDLHSLVYSSGTTGREKVLMISRRGASAALAWMGEAFDIGPGDRHLVFLPLPNFQQRQQIFACLHSGVDIALCGYDRAMQTIRSARPTFLLAPPALYENMLLVSEDSGAPLPALFGGAIRFMVTGMAAIRPRVLAAYWDAGLKLLEGYGLTECGIIACNTLDRFKPGTVGPLTDPSAFSLSDDGEIVIRQRHPLSLGYLGADDLNQAVHRADGSIMTGDLGHLDEDGFLILDGRLKEMIPLPSGKKLNPADLEQILLQAPGVEDAIAVDNGGGVTAVLNVSDGVTEAAIRAALRGYKGSLDASGAVNQIILTDIPLTANPIFSTANMKLNRRLVGRHFLGLDR